MKFIRTTPLVLYGDECLNILSVLRSYEGLDMGVRDIETLNLYIVLNMMRLSRKLSSLIMDEVTHPLHRRELTIELVS